MKPARTMKRLASDENGGMLVIWGVSFAIFFGIVALSFDVGRTAITRTELQSFADHVALAAAGELDGGADAIIRATAAAQNMISDNKTFGSGGRQLSGDTDYTLTFLSDLPDDDADLVTATTTDATEAAYVLVETTPSTITATFGAVFATLTGNALPNGWANGSAIAGFTQYACDVTPMMFCLPSPSYKADENIGDMILLRSGGNGAAWGPGDFGFLDPAKTLVDDEGPCAGLSGVNLDACLIGAEGSITQCFNMRGVDIEPGQKNGIENAIYNVRFDIYRSIMNGKKNNTNFPPAPNVIKGIVSDTGNACIGGNTRGSNDSRGLPRDTCLLNGGTCSRFGDGNWSTGRAEYVDYNYDGTDPHPSATTRYEYYLAEINAAPSASSPLLIGREETGRPMCSNNQSTDPERRVIIVAGIDCDANPINGAATNVPVQEFFKVFLTEPVGEEPTTPPTVNIYGEIVGSASEYSPGAGSLFHDVVQLYR